MNFNKRILTADIGSGSFKIAEFVYANSVLTLLFVKIIEYPLTLTDDEQKIEFIKKSLIDLKSIYRFKTKKIAISIIGQNVFTRFAKLPLITKKQNVGQLIQYEAKQNIPFQLNEVVWSYQIVEGTEDSKNVLFVAVKNEIINPIADVFEDVGFKIVDITMGPAVIYNLIAAANLVNNKTVGILNIGHKSSTFIIAEGGNFFVRTIPFGGFAITQEIAKDFNLGFDEAEKIKKNNGYVALNSKPLIEGDNSNIDSSQSIRNIMLKIWGEISRSVNVYKFQQGGGSLQELYITTTVEMIKYTTEFFEEKLKIPVHKLNAFNFIKTYDYIEKETTELKSWNCTELISLAVSRFSSTGIKISLISDYLKNKIILREKSPYIYMSMFLLLSVLFICRVSIQKQEKVINGLIKSAESEIKQTSEEVKKIKTLKDELNKTTKRYGDLKSIIDKRNDWFTVINGIQTALPDNVWILELEPTQSPNVTQARRQPTLFGRRPERDVRRQVEDSSDTVGWIRIRARSLVLNSEKRQTDAELFKENLVKSKLFSDSPDDIIILDYKLSPVQSNNFDSFVILAKLKQSISL